MHYANFYTIHQIDQKENQAKPLFLTDLYNNSEIGRVLVLHLQTIAKLICLPLWLVVFVGTYGATHTAKQCLIYFESH